MLTTIALAAALLAPLPQVAHRGDPLDGATENTHAALRHAAQAGYAGVEFDVRFTKDGRAVLLHDTTLNRTSNCSGKLSSMRLSEVGVCRTPDGSKIPTLLSTTQYLAKLKYSGTVLIHVKEPLSSSAAAGLVKAARELPNEEQHVVFLVENPPEAAALRKAGWDGKDEGRTHMNAPWASGKMYGAKDVERMGLMVHTAADWSLPGYQVLVPYAPVTTVGYDAAVTPERAATAHAAGQKLICMPDLPTPVADLVAAPCDALMAE